MNTHQQRVLAFCKENNLVSPAEHCALDTLSELGELTKEILKASNYGRQVFTPDTSRILDELGDLYYSFITLANFFELDLDIALDQALDKYAKRLERDQQDLNRRELSMKIIRSLVILLAGVSFMVSQNAVGDQELPNFDLMWNYTDPQATQVLFNSLLPQAESSGNASYHAQLLSQIARTQGLQRQFDEAHATLDQAEKLVTPQMVTARIRLLLERGRVYNSSGNPDTSKTFFLEALEISENYAKEFWGIDAAHMLGIVEPPENQLDWSLKALELAKRSEDQRAQSWLGALYNNIGWTYHDLGNYDKALFYFLEGLTWRQQVKDDAGTRIAKWTIGRVYRSQGKIKEAIQIHENLEREIIEKELPPDGYVFEELGECYLIQSDSLKAKSYFGKAYDALSPDPWLMENEAERLSRLKKLGGK